MSTGYLYILHGRRNKVPESNLDLLRDFAASRGQKATIGFLEGEEQTLEDGIHALLDDGISRLVLVPVLLYSATHMRWDIPERTAKVLDPLGGKVELTVTGPLATTEAVERYEERVLGEAVRQHPGHRVLLVAHGTPHFPEPFEQLQALAARVEAATDADIVCTNHIGHPKIEETLAQEHGPFVVERLFLTDGRLANKIKNRVLALEPDAVFLPTLEDDPVITEAIAERLAEVGA